MSKRMLIDASHPEETRVVVLDGNKVEEFDFEAASKRPLKGNIYLAKVTRVEPSLQAAFVEYGGNRQGFLAFSEIHPDYYQIPVADRQALIEAQAERLRQEEEFDHVETGTAPSGESVAETAVSGEGEQTSLETASEDNPETGDAEIEDEEAVEENEGGIEASGETLEAIQEHLADEAAEETEANAEPDHHGDEEPVSSDEIRVPADGWPGPSEADASGGPSEIFDNGGGMEGDSGVSHSLAEATGAPQPEVRRDTRPQQRHSPRPRRRTYKIQEVIKRRQIMLVQVVKEERGTKGASLTTFLSLAGRYCVLMPNTPRGGGISRKITSATDRKRLKSAAQGLELPEGMGLIIRTAGASRTKVEIKRDYEYLLRLWDSVRELTLKSNAPALVYEEGNLVKRVIRDLYGKDISEVVVDGDAGYRDAKDFMKMILPSHAKNVKPYKDPTPLFQRHHVEAQLDAMFSPTVTLKSGGYIVINQTEALVSIDVNSGKATREHSIEETAHKTNLEAADEIGRQLRLRDLAGLIVIDFIDMEDGRNDRNVEKRLQNAVKNDRARVQIGKISQFGLLEMSRQRLRAGVIAGSTVTCPHCNGQGLIRSTESAALRLLRALDEEGQHKRAADLKVKAPPDVTIYALNQKRREIARIEEAHDLIISFDPQQTMMGGSFEIEQIGTHTPSLKPPAATAVSIEAGYQEAEEPSEADNETETETDTDVTLADPPDGMEMDVEASPNAQPTQQQQGQQSSSSGKRRRRRGGRGRGSSSSSQGQQQPHQHHQQQTQQPRPPQQQNSQHASGNGAQQHTHSGQPNQQGEQQGQPGSSSSRRRRRRRGRGGSKSQQPGTQQQQSNGDGNNPQPHYAESAQDSEMPAMTSGSFPPRDERNHEMPVANAPSEPQWSFTPEAQTSARVAEREQPVMRNEPREAAETTVTRMEESRAPRAEPLPEAPTPTEKKGGWWQRRFKSGD